jgi:hypothetical protein
MDNLEGPRPEPKHGEIKHSRRQKKVFYSAFSVQIDDKGNVDYANLTLEDMMSLSFADRAKINFNLPLNFQRTLFSVIDLFSPERDKYTNAKNFKLFLKRSPYFSGIESHPDIIRKVMLREVSFQELQVMRKNLPASST